MRDKRNNAQNAGEILKRERKSRGLTQAQLASKIGVAHQEISRVETGRDNTGVETLARVAEALDLKLSVQFVSRRP